MIGTASGRLPSGWANMYRRQIAVGAIDRRRRGLSLIDLALATLIMGIMAATAVPRFSDALNRNRVLCAAQRVAADLRFVRSQAIASSASRRVDFSVAQSRYTLVSINSIDRPSTTYSVDLADLFQSTLTTVTLGSDASITFDLHGQPDSGGTISVRCGSMNRTITVSAATGAATIN